LKYTFKLFFFDLPKNGIVLPAQQKGLYLNGKFTMGAKKEGHTIVLLDQLQALGLP